MKNRFEKSDLFIGPQLMLGAFVMLLFFYVNNTTSKSKLEKHDLFSSCVEKDETCHVCNYLNDQIAFYSIAIEKCFACLFYTVVICFFAVVIIRLFGVDKKPREKDVINMRGMLISGLIGLGLIVYVTNTLLG